MLARRPATSSSSSSSSLLSLSAGLWDEVDSSELRPMGMEEKGLGVYQARARLSWLSGAVGRMYETWERWG